MTTELHSETTEAAAGASRAGSFVVDYIASRAPSLEQLNAQLLAELQTRETAQHEMVAMHAALESDLRKRIAFLEGELRVRDQRIIELQLGRRFQKETVRSSELQAILPGTNIEPSSQQPEPQSSDSPPSSDDSPNPPDDGLDRAQPAHSDSTGAQGAAKPPSKTKAPRRKRELPIRKMVSYPEGVLREGLSKFECIGAEVSSEIVRRNATHVQLVTIRPKYKRVDSDASKSADAIETSDSTQALDVELVQESLNSCHEIGLTALNANQRGANADELPSIDSPAASTVRATIPGYDCASALFAHECLTVPEDPRFNRCPYSDGAVVRYLPHRQSDDKDPTPRILIAPAALKPFDNAKVDASVIANIFVEKFLYHDPFHRQQRDSERDGVPIGRNAMSAWQKLVGPNILFLANAMWNDVLTKAEWIAMDATTLPVRDPTSGQLDYSHVFTLFAESHALLYRPVKEQNGDTVRELFGDFRGPILCDACSCHNALFGPGKPAMEVGCWQHCRKPFKAAFDGDDRLNGAKGLSFVKDLFKAERDISSLSPAEKQWERQIRCKPIVDDFFTWVHGSRGKIGTSVEKGFTYAANQESALRAFLDNGKLPASNNISERSLRHIVRGRINWLFAGSEDAAEQSMAIISVLQTAVLLGLEPRFYLQELLTLLPHYKGRNVLDLAPHRWLDTRERLIRSGELRYIDIGTLCSKI